MSRRRERRAGTGTWATARSVGLTVLGVMTFNAFVAQAYVIPSGSMEPSLLVGDRLFVNKAAFGLRLPFGTRWLVTGRSPQRGEIVVFSDPRDPTGEPLIKRVVALGGDTVEVAGGQLVLNGHPVQRRALSAGETSCHPPPAPCLLRFEEVLGTHRFTVVHQRHRPAPDYSAARVPEGSFFVMGDNRDDSNDSRFWGPVPRSHLLGKAGVIYWSHGDGAVRWGRMLKPVHD